MRFHKGWGFWGIEKKAILVERISSSKWEALCPRRAYR